jgi:hypothetical protein
MYVFTQRLFPVPYQWGRLARVVCSAAVLVAVGELVLPTSGLLGFVGRAALWALYPLALWATGFFTPEERGWIARLRHPGAVLAGIAALRSQPPAVDGTVPEVYEAERQDEDRTV